MTNSQLITNIKNVCKAQNIPFGEMLEQCGLSKGFMYDVEKRDRTPSIEKITAIADYLCVSVDYLLGRTQEMNSQYYNIGNNNLNNNGNGTITNGTAIQQSDITAEMIEKFNGLCFDSKVKVINLIAELSQNKAG